MRFHRGMERRRPKRPGARTSSPQQVAFTQREWFYVARRKHEDSGTKERRRQECCGVTCGCGVLRTRRSALLKRFSSAEPRSCCGNNHFLNSVSASRQRLISGFNPSELHDPAHSLQPAAGPGASRRLRHSQGLPVLPRWRALHGMREVVGDIG